MSYSACGASYRDVPVVEAAEQVFIACVHSAVSKPDESPV